MFVMATELAVEQNTDEWKAARIGLVTSSELNNVLMDPSKAGYRNYRAQITLEQLTGKTPERFMGNKFTDWGHETEDLAVMSYTLRTGVQVRKCGIFIHKFLKVGDSPDGVAIDQPGCMEVKCKSSANHLETLKLGHMPKIHKPQVQNHIQMTGSEWCDYISFDPDFPPNSQLFIERIYKDEEYCKKLILQSSLFLDAIEADIKFLKGYEQKPWTN
jgi:hypothetical protein